MVGVQIWYAGRISNIHDLKANIAVLARKQEKEWEAVENSKKLFSKSGEVEVSLSFKEKKTIKVGDWFAFQLAGGSKGGGWVLSNRIKLQYYIDLSHVGALEDVRRILVTEGISTDKYSGSWVVRISKNEVIKVLLNKWSGHGDRLYLLNAEKFMGYVFDELSVLDLRIGADHFNLYRLPEEAVPDKYYDWSTDERYVLRVLKTLSGVDKSLINDVIKWLERHADEQKSMALLNGNDLVAAYEALRSGKIAKQMQTDVEALCLFYKLLSNDQRIQGLINSRVEHLVGEAESEIRKKLELEVQDELSVYKRQSLEALNCEIENLRSKLHEEVEYEFVAARKKVESEIQSLRNEGMVSIKTQLMDCQKVLEGEIEDLTNKKCNLEHEISEMSSRELKLRREIEDLSKYKEDAICEVDRLLATIKEISPKSCGNNILIPSVEHKPSLLLKISDLENIVSDSLFLTEKGKVLMLNFLALMLAGEVPILYGPQVTDFLIIAGQIVSAGYSVTFESDPTIITFDDLWIRAGSGVPTSLAQALRLSSTINPVSQLAIINKIERSGARFWLSSLIDRKRSGDIPRNLLMCVTVEDMKCAEFEHIKYFSARLNLVEVVDANSSKIYFTLFDRANCYSLDVGQFPLDQSPGIRAVSSSAKILPISLVMRAASVATELIGMCSDAGQIKCVEDVTELFVEIKKARDNDQEANLGGNNHVA